MFHIRFFPSNNPPVASVHAIKYRISIRIREDILEYVLIQRYAAL
jgi:hypothetical protein